MKPLVKDKSILSLVEHLESKFGKDSFNITDYWEGDLCAIGFSDLKNQFLIYVSTWKRNKYEYFVNLEDISKGEDTHIVIQSFECVDLKKLESLFTSHILRD
ncbi:MAG: hypothetical protein GC178_00440 [Flavobacteriales bacterium]|nr:hypothetical protein [Flavobacteriales bacterium]